jgi:hypothetical protein
MSRVMMAARCFVYLLLNDFLFWMIKELSPKQTILLTRSTVSRSTFSRKSVSWVRNEECCHDFSTLALSSIFLRAEAASTSSVTSSHALMMV